MAATAIDTTEESLALPMQSMIDQGVLTATAFHVGAVVTLTPRSDDDDLSQVPEFLQWAAIGSWLGGIQTAAKWWIGDWLNFGEGAWGERYAQAAEVTGLDIGTLQNYAYVCRQVLPSRRREGLSFTSHYAVAKLEPADQDEWLAHADRTGIRSRDLREQIKQLGGQVPGERHEETHEPNGNGDGPQPEQRIDLVRLQKAAARVWKNAQRDGDAYRVPNEAFRELAAALGKGD